MPIRILKKDDESKKNKSKTVSKEEATNMRKDATRDYVRANKMLVGGQAKLDKNKNNRIDAQDFKILRQEKAKGRGQGLQDEKMKPGKPMKAALGAIALGLGAKKMKEKGEIVSAYVAYPARLMVKTSKQPGAKYTLAKDFSKVKV